MYTLHQTLAVTADVTSHGSPTSHKSITTIKPNSDFDTTLYSTMPLHQKHIIQPDFNIAIEGS